MAPKRKREAASQQENAPERQLRSGKSTALPSNGSPRKSPRKPRSRSPRKKAVKAIIETQDEDDEDNDDNDGKPFKARKLSPPEPLVQKKTRQAAGTLQEDVNSLLEEIPSGKPLKRQRHSSPDKETAKSSKSVQSTTQAEVKESRESAPKHRTTVEVLINLPKLFSTPTTSLPQEQRSEGSLAGSHSGTSSCLMAQKRAILQALRQSKVPSLSRELSTEPTTMNTAQQQLSDLIHGTVSRGEGNSCLLLGPRGSGKSMLLEQVLVDLPDRPVILRLAGWVQTSDKLALREIALQLLQQTGSSFLVDENEPSVGHQVMEDDDENPFLDEHPKAHEFDQPIRLPPSSQLHALIPILLTLGRPVVVVLDGFDMFAMHPRQSLLYCLLDSVQSCHATPQNRGIAVIGVTTRMDTTQLLEKRVKSRFSGRVIRTAPPATLADWLLLSKSILLSPISSEVGGDERGKWQQEWNSSIQSLLDDDDVLNAFHDTFSVTKDVTVLYRLLMRTVLRLSPDEPLLSSKHILSSVDSQRTRPGFLHLNNLPYPTMCLLISSVHAYTAGHDSFTFELLHEKFRDQLRSSTSAPVQVNGGHIGMVKCTRDVLLTAYSDLKSAKIFLPATAPSSSLAKEYVRYRSILDREAVKRVVEKSGQVYLKKWLLKGG